jgi:hypothetical protein
MNFLSLIHPVSCRSDSIVELNHPVDGPALCLVREPKAKALFIYDCGPPIILVDDSGQVARRVSLLQAKQKHLVSSDVQELGYQLG